MIVESALASDFASLFATMESSPMATPTVAAEFAKIIAKHIKTAGVPAGTVVISASGATMNPAEILIK